jgi:hypothetical protein
MFLNYDVLRLIIAEINDPATLYSLILTSKWFRKELQARFSAYFEPQRVDVNAHIVLHKPRIYHPIRQSHIDEHEKNGNHMIISKSGGYKIMQNLTFHQHKGIGIELKSYDENPVNVYIDGTNKILKWFAPVELRNLENESTFQSVGISLAEENNNRFIFINCENEPNYMSYLCNLKVICYGRAAAFRYSNVLGAMLEDICMEEIPQKPKLSISAKHYSYVNLNDEDMWHDGMGPIGQMGNPGPVEVPYSNIRALRKKEYKKNKMTWLDKKYQFKQLQRNQKNHKRH